MTTENHVLTPPARAYRSMMEDRFKQSYELECRLADIPASWTSDKRESLMAETLDMRRKLFCASLCYAVRFIWGGANTDDPDFRFIPDFYWELDYIRYRGHRKRRQLILIPRGYGKSDTLIVTETLQDLMANPNENIGLCSADLSLPVGQVKMIKTLCMQHELLRATFRDRIWEDPPKQSPCWRDDAITLPRGIVRKEPSLAAFSLSANETGHHYRQIKCDDLVTMKNTETVDQIEKVKGQIAMIEPLLDAPTNDREMLVIGTRYDHKDAYGGMKEDSAYAVLERPSLVVPTPTGAVPWNGPDFQVEADGVQALFPQLDPIPKQLERRKSPLLAGMFASQYLLDPSATGTPVFKRDWVKYWDESPQDREKVEGTFLVYYTAVDPAASINDDADWSVITTVGFDSERHGYVVQIDRGRWTQGELISRAFQHRKKWKPRLIFWEAVGFQRRDITAVRERESKTGLSMPIVPITSRPVSKKQRLKGTPENEGFAHYMATGQVSFKKIHAEIVEEILRYPKGHDDVLDTLADIFARAVPAPESAQTTHYDESGRPIHPIDDFQDLTWHGIG